MRLHTVTVFPPPRILAALALAAGVSRALAQPVFDYSIDFIEHPSNGFALYPMAINNDGVVAGWWYGSPADNREPFTYTQGGGYVVMPKPAGFAHSVPMDINDSGVIVGFAQTTWNDEGNPRGWKFENGQFTLFGPQTSAVDVNESGLIVGKACLPQGGLNFTCFFSSTQPPAATTFPGAAGYPVSMWKYIHVNDLGQTAYTASGSSAVFEDADGTITPLPAPPAPFTGIRVDGINNAGQVIARWTRSTSGSSIRRYSRGFIWSAATGAQEFGVSVGSVRPQAINNLGQVVFESGGHDQQFFDTWVWSAATGPRNFDNLVDPGVELYLTDLYDINDAGQVLARGSTALGNGYVVLNPTTPPAPPCDPDLNADGNVDQDDVACIIDTVAGNPGCTSLDPDFNGDGNVDQDDVAAVINVVAGGTCP